VQRKQFERPVGVLGLGSLLLGKEGKLRRLLIPIEQAGLLESWEEVVSIIKLDAFLAMLSNLSVPGSVTSASTPSKPPEMDRGSRFPWQKSYRHLWSRSERSFGLFAVRDLQYIV
jgi:hypothetical protein